MKAALWLCIFPLGAAAQDLRQVAEPVIPPACATLTAQLSTQQGKLRDADEHNLDTARIQQALDACTPGHSVELIAGTGPGMPSQRERSSPGPAAPGSVVPASSSRTDNSRDAFLSGPLDLRKGVALVVGPGVTLFASRDPRVFDITPGVCGTVSKAGTGPGRPSKQEGTARSPAAPGSVVPANASGGGARGCRPLLSGSQVEGAAVMGLGTGNQMGVIDGRGGDKLLGPNGPLDVTWWDLAEQARAGGIQNNFRLLVLNRCDNFTLYGIRLKNSPNFHVSYSSGNGFTVWSVMIDAPKNARNSDGIDPANSTNVTITHSFIRAGDDNVAIKAGGGLPTTHMTIAHNHFYYGHGMSIGSETNGGASAIRVSDLSIDGADNGIRIKSNSARGGLVEDIVYQDVCIRATKNPLLFDTHYSGNGYVETGTRIPDFRNIILRNVSITGPGKITLDGFDTMRRLGLTFDNVNAGPAASIQIAASHANLTFGPGPVNIRPSGEDVAIATQPGQNPPYTCEEKFVPFPAN